MKPVHPQLKKNTADITVSKNPDTKPSGITVGTDNYKGRSWWLKSKGPVRSCQGVASPTLGSLMCHSWQIIPPSERLLQGAPCSLGQIVDRPYGSKTPICVTLPFILAFCFSGEAEEASPLLSDAAVHHNVFFKPYLFSPNKQVLVGCF